MKTTKTKQQITTRNGYAVGVRCGVNHSGNHGLARLIRGYWQCQGCATGYTEEALLTRKANPGGEIGNGGVISA